MRLQSSEAFGCFLHSRRGPAQRHRGRSPSLHVAADATHGAHDILHDVGAGERPTKFFRQAEPRDGEDFVEALQNARRYARRIVFQPSREIADQLLGLVGVVQLPGLAQHPADGRVHWLRQPLHDVASLVNLAPLNQRLTPEAAPDRFRERLRSVDDEQPRHRRIEPARDEIVDERLHHGGVLGRAFNEPERMLHAFAVDFPPLSRRCTQLNDRVGEDVAILGPGQLFSRLPTCRRALAWTRAGSHRFPGDPSRAFAPVQDPGRTDDPSPNDGFVDAAPALPTAKAPAIIISRLLTRLQHLLPTLQERCCHHPCKARFRLAGSPLPGGS